MKLSPSLLVAVIAFLLPAAASAQLTLSAGESYTFQFNTLESYGIYSGYPPNGINYATFESARASEDPGDAFRVEIFENTTSDTPLAVNSGLGSVTAQAEGGWHDLQGFARVTVTSGTLTLNTLSIGVARPIGFGEFETFNSGVVPVPEPGAIALWSCATAGLIITLRRRLQRSR